MRKFVSPKTILRANFVLQTCHPRDSELSGRFRRSASLALPHRRSFASIPSVSLVHLGHTNRNFLLPRGSLREIALV